MFQINIKKSTAEEALTNRHLWSLELEVTSTDSEVSDKVFVYHADADGKGVVGDLFECVASVQQLVEVPELEPVTGVPYYRKNVASYYCRSAQERLELEEGIVEDLRELKEHILASRNLTIDKTVTI